MKLSHKSLTLSYKFAIELQEDLQLLVDSLRYKNDDEEQQRQALQTIATMCSENGELLSSCNLNSFSGETADIYVN